MGHELYTCQMAPFLVKTLVVKLTYGSSKLEYVLGIDFQTASIISILIETIMCLSRTHIYLFHGMENYHSYLNDYGSFSLQY